MTIKIREEYFPEGYIRMSYNDKPPKGYIRWHRFESKTPLPPGTLKLYYYVKTGPDIKTEEDIERYFLSAQRRSKC